VPTATTIDCLRKLLRPLAEKVATAGTVAFENRFFNLLANDDGVGIIFKMRARAACRSDRVVGGNL